MAGRAFLGRAGRPEPEDRALPPVDFYWTVGVDAEAIEKLLEEVRGDLPHAEDWFRGRGSGPNVATTNPGGTPSETPEPS